MPKFNNILQLPLHDEKNESIINNNKSNFQSKDVKNGKSTLHSKRKRLHNSKKLCKQHCPHITCCNENIYLFLNKICKVISNIPYLKI